MIPVEHDPAVMETAIGRGDWHRVVALLRSQGAVCDCWQRIRPTYVEWVTCGHCDMVHSASDSADCRCTPCATRDGNANWEAA